MAESFLFSIAGKLLTKLGSVAFQELAFAWGVRKDLEALESMLSSVKAVLLDAEEQQAKNHELREWLRQLKDVFYEAEDVVDEFECELMRKNVVKNYGSMGRKVGRFFSRANPLFFRFDMAYKIKAIREKFDVVAANRTKFGLRERFEDRRMTLGGNRETHSFVRASEIFGRENEKDEIIELLLQPNEAENVTVIPIVGIGGVGKTTLAKFVYNDQTIENEKFYPKLWVHVSDEFNLRKLLKKIIESATDGTCGIASLDQLQKRVRDIVEGKKFLLVLDDVWNEDRKAWEGLETLLMGGSKGSKILVTTRSSKVASMVGSIPMYRLGVLSDEHSLSLFKNLAFRKGDEMRHSSLVEIGTQIVRKCAGIPLALKTVASLLYSKTDMQDWLSIRENEIWKLPQNEGDFLPALKLSYDLMPSHLKRCFSLFSIFPKGHFFFSITLTHIWRAHGLLEQPDGSEDSERVANQYINELYSRSFVQDLEFYGDFSSFRVHDLVHDLALLVAKEECFYVTECASMPGREMRYLCFSPYSDSLGQEIVRSLHNPQKIRTVIFHTWRVSPSQCFVDQCIMTFKCLRMLDLAQASFEELPSSIGRLKHLRFLELSYNERLKKLPSSICKLQSLETLKLNGCRGLEELPKHITNLINLRFFGVTTKQRILPNKGLDHWNSLQHLRFYFCGNMEQIFEEMQHLTALRTLNFSACGRLKSLHGSLKHLPALEQIFISKCESLDLETIEEDDSEPGWSQLRTLVINYVPKLVRVPRWLEGSKSCFRHLILLNCPYIMELPEWLPNLSSLELIEISNCPRLMSLPEGMHHIVSLGQLIISDCPALSHRCSRETGEDWSKIAHVSEIRVDDVKI